jgi:hypothetical protein
MAKKITSRPVPRRHRERIDEVVLNALAFSTLLSSQETGAHHPPALTALPGQPSHSTLRSPSCQRRFPDRFRIFVNRQVSWPLPHLKSGDPRWRVRTLGPKASGAAADRQALIESLRVEPPGNRSCLAARPVFLATGRTVGVPGPIVKSFRRSARNARDYPGHGTRKPVKPSSGHDLNRAGCPGYDPRVTFTPPMVRLPRRSTRKPPGSSRPSDGTACSSVTFSLLR